MLTLKQLQDEQKPWVQHNFPDRKAHVSLLGALEELGELAHAHVKGELGIRGEQSELDEKAKDAVADVIIFLSDYCTAKGYDLQECLETTWQKVKQRDWRKDPRNGTISNSLTKS